MSVLLSLAVAAVMSPIQKPPPPAGNQIPKIEGVPTASKLVPLKNFELEVSRATALKFRPIQVKTFAFTKDLRTEINQRVGPARDQGNRPTGTIHAVTFLSEFIFSKKGGGNNINLSEEYLNAVANSVGGNVQDGDHLFNAFRAYMAAGDCREQLLPYRPAYALGIPISAALRADGTAHRRGVPVWIKPFMQASVPPQNVAGHPAWPPVQGQGAAPAMLQAIKVHLAAGFPAAVTVRWPNDPFVGTTEVAGIDLFKMPAPPQAPYSKGIAIVGFKDDPRFPGGGVFIFRNSEGRDWGDNGYGYMSYLYVRNLALGILVFR
jgi:hypothetical protein